jgi:O-acetyl-ADP-ribose deacetylase (regulator of RNase III)
VAEVFAAGRDPIGLDLRAHGRPPLALPLALDAAIAALDGEVRLECLVANDRVAESLRAKLHPAESRSAIFRIGPRRVEVLTGNIVAVPADAIVNASNTALRLGSGVSAALRRACGPSLQSAMSQLAPIESGGLAVTNAFELETVTQRILHVATVSGTEDDVRRALSNILAYCSEHELASVAVPALGTGSGGLGIDRCAELFREAIAAHTAASPELVRVVAWSESDFDAFVRAFRSDARFAESQ